MISFDRTQLGILAYSDTIEMEHHRSRISYLRPSELGSWMDVIADLDYSCESSIYCSDWSPVIKIGMACEMPL